MLRFGRRSYGTLVKIWPRGTPAATSGEGLCVYITGFMSDTKDDGYWESWLPAHRQLVAAPLPWPEQAYGYRWQTGATGDWLGRWPLPVHAAALLARRSSPAALLAGITADSLVNATRCTPAILFSPSTLRTHPHQPHTPPAPPSPHPTPTLSPSPADHPQHSTPSRLLLHYRSAESAAVAEAPRLARACAAFGGDYRVVAHSLGCRLALEALPSLPAEQRPREVRLRRSPSFSSSTHGHAAGRWRWLEELTSRRRHPPGRCTCWRRRRPWRHTRRGWRSFAPRVQARCTTTTAPTTRRSPQVGRK